MTQRRRLSLALSLLVLAGCDRFGGAIGGQAATPGYGAQAPNGQPYAQGPQGQPYPQGEQFPQGQPIPQGQQYPSAPGMPPGGGAPPNLDQLAAWERQDAGVQASNQLHAGPMHGPTPSTIPGGQVITTKGLLPLIQGGTGVPVLVLDVLGNPQMQLPNAAPAVFASQPGSYNDAVQQQFGQMLNQLTQGNKQVPIVTYCQGPQCWMSYNAALRAIALGYRNVLWYRGGLEAWQQAMSLMGGGGPPQAMGEPMTPSEPGMPGDDND